MTAGWYAYTSPLLTFTHSMTIATVSEYRVQSTCLMDRSMPHSRRLSIAHKHLPISRTRGKQTRVDESHQLGTASTGPRREDTDSFPRGCLQADLENASEPVSIKCIHKQLVRICPHRTCSFINDYVQGDNVLNNFIHLIFSREIHHFQWIQSSTWLAKDRSKQNNYYTYSGNTGILPLTTLEVILRHRTIWIAASSVGSQVSVVDRSRQRHRSRAPNVHVA